MTNQRFKRKIELRKKIKPFAVSGDIFQGGHITVPKKFVGFNAKIEIDCEVLICKRCVETFEEKKNFSEHPDYCKNCLESVKFLEKNKGKLKCQICKKKISEETYKQFWDREICEKCWLKDAEEEERKQNLNGDTEDDVEE